MNPDNLNGRDSEKAPVPLGFRPAVAKRVPWRPVNETPGLDVLLDKLIPAVSVRRPVVATEARIAEFCAHLNAGVRHSAHGHDEADWASAEWVAYMERQPEYLGTEYVYGEPIEFFLVGGQVLVWCVDALEWQHAVDTTVALAVSR